MGPPTFRGTPHSLANPTTPESTPCDSPQCLDIGGRPPEQGRAPNVAQESVQQPRMLLGDDNNAIHGEKAKEGYSHVRSAPQQEVQLPRRPRYGAAAGASLKATHPWRTTTERMRKHARAHKGRMATSSCVPCGQLAAKCQCGDCNGARRPRDNYHLRRVSFLGVLGRASRVCVRNAWPAMSAPIPAHERHRTTSGARQPLAFSLMPTGPRRRPRALA